MKTGGSFRRHDVYHADGEEVEVLVKGSEDARCQVIAARLTCGGGGWGPVIVERALLIRIGGWDWGRACGENGRRGEQSSS